MNDKTATRPGDLLHEQLSAFKAMLDQSIEDSKNGRGRPADEFFDEWQAEIRERRCGVNEARSAPTTPTPPTAPYPLARSSGRASRR